MKLLWPLFGALSCLVLSACMVNPVTGKQEFTLMPPAQEVAKGESLYPAYQQQQGGAYELDPGVNRYVNQVGQKLAAVSDRQLPYEFVVLNNSVPNAWALPGGKIAINRGLLVMLDDEAQLAAVLGHEITHAAARHSAKQMTQSTLLGLGMAVAGVQAQRSQYSEWILAGAGVTAAAWQAKYGRDQELEADQYGVEYMVKAGYDPQGAVELQEKFVQLSQGQQNNFMATLFASHPPSQERVARNRGLVAGRTGERNRQAFANALSQLKRDLPAYEAHNQALAAAQQGQFDQALVAIDRAIELQPQEALFHVTRGQLGMASRNQDLATESFQQAVRHNPNYYLGFLGLGMAQKSAGQAGMASQALNRSMTLLPTPIAAFHLGDLSLSQGDRVKARQYFQMAAEAGGEIGQAAQAQLARLGTGY